MKKICGGTFDEERAFYGEKDLVLEDVSFDGPKDGESALKECKNIEVLHGFFNLRYPLWHDHNLKLFDTALTENCRAAIWYSENIEIRNSKLFGIKAVRESKNIILNNNEIISPEFGWDSKNIEVSDTSINSEYLFLRAKNIHAKRLNMKGKYSFQYIESSSFENCEFDTKDAFWHGKNIIIKDSYVKGEYLAWYSKNLTFINCVIEGTQPFCYSKNLTLIGCEMRKTDLAFERSTVKADIKGHIDSVKNPLKGSKIIADSIGEVIRDIDSALGEVKTRG